MKEDISTRAFLAFENGASIDETRAILGCGRNKAIRILKDHFGPEKYSELAKRLIVWRRIEASRKTNKGRKCPPRSEEWCKKISEAKKGKKISEEHKRSISKTLKDRIATDGFWLNEEQIAAKAEKARQTKIKNGVYEKWNDLIHPYRLEPISKEGRKNMSIARNNFYARGGQSPMLGKKHTEEAMKKISDFTKKQWEDGVFDNNSGLWRSKLEIKVFDYLCERYDCTHSHRIERKVFDVYIKKLNLLIEVNGDYWHLNPELYDHDYYDEHRKILASDVWNSDNEKRKLAEDSGFSFCVLWQRDLELDFIGTIENHVKKFC